MGVLSDVVKQFDTSGEQKQEISETLDLMVELTKAKADQYKQTIEDSLNNAKVFGNGGRTGSLYFPITSVKDSRAEYRCVAQDHPSDMVNEIADSISGMIEDGSAESIVKGVASIINTALVPILGQSSGAEQYCATTSTFIEGSGLAVNIVRFDCIIWGRSVSAKSIKEKIDVTLACVAYKSVVDVTKLTFSDFRAVYAPVVEASDIKDTIEALKKAKEVYDLLEGGSGLKKSDMKMKDDSEGKNLSISDLIYHSDSIMTNDGKF